MFYSQNNHNVKLSASVMCANWWELGADISKLESLNIDYLHYDIMDGFFVGDYCLGTNIINEIRKHTVIKSDYHLMVEEPMRIIENFNDIKDGDILTIHYEACRNLHRDLVKLKKMGFKAGLALNPATTINQIEYVIEEVDVIVIMTVNPGYKGQKLVPQTLKKLHALNELKNKYGYQFDIEVDGNVNPEFIPKMVSNGANILVGGSSGLFIKNQPLEKSVEEINALIMEGFE